MSISKTKATPSASAPEGGAGRAAEARDLAQATAAVADLQANYTTWVREDLNAMQAALKAARDGEAKRAEHLGELFDICHNVKAQGSTFGYPLMTWIGGSLCDFLRDGSRGTEAHLKVTEAHIAAMLVVVVNQIAGEGGDAGSRLLEQLTELAARADR